MTGLHALHIIAGMIVISLMIYRTFRNQFSAEYYTPLELTGLYWHLVDVIWIYLFPLLYLIG
jgi:cytochrome c oxidase subunit 3